MLLTLVILPTAVTGSGVALPHIGRDTHAPLAALQWVVHGYNLTFASFMLACGSLADIFGRRRMFLTGGILFALASLVSAVVSDIYVLDLARAAAGIGAAALLTSGSSLLAATFDGAARTRAFAAVGIVTGAGLALGAMAAGVLADAWGWRSFFGAHAVVMALVLLAVPFMRESRDSSAARIDWAGTGTLVAGLFLLMLGVVEGPHWGWSSAPVLGLLAGAALLMAVFVVVERRQRQPMLDLALLRNPRFMALCLVPVVATFAFVILLPLLPNYLLIVNQASSRTAGATMLLMTLPILPTPILAGKLIRWGLSLRAVIAASLTLMTLGVAWLALILHPGVTAAELAGPLITLGVGLGLNFGLVDGAVLTVVPPETTGTAAGFLNTLRLGSEAIVIAAAGSALVNLFQGKLSERAGHIPGDLGASDTLADSVNAGDLTGALAAVPPGTARSALFDIVAQDFTASWQILLWGSAAVCAVLSVVVVVMLAERRRTSS
ncbi:MFS transporter [Nocardia sp. NPDC019395]|uniref:MFS transporter n=1 Tax=Nocardia sp. NPDC019395 TaxID=3154686 RepID=UPI003402AFB9